jgi:outer membrane receptor for ferrienterochelin and colicin
MQLIAGPTDNGFDHSPMRRAMSLRTILPALLVSLFIGLPALADSAAAQGGATTGAIFARTLDAEGGPVAGAQVVAVNQETGFERTGLTNQDGRVTLRLLPPGVYTVRVERLGFRTTEMSDVLVALGQVANVTLELTGEAIQLEGIQVTGAPARVNTRQATLSQNVSVAEIEDLPALGRDFTDFISLSGLVVPTPETTTGGQFAIGGQRPSQTNLQIDGVDSNNSFFGENRGGSRLPFSFSLESIREFQVITNGFDVEYGNYSGGVVNVITRGGTNRFEGTGYINYRGDALTAADFAGEQPVDFSATQFAARLSGPIIENKLFYLFSLDGQIRREPQVPLTPGEVEPGTAQEMQEFFNILENQYGVQNAAAGYQPFQTTQDQITLFGRVDWTINPSHRLSVRHNWIDYTNADEWSRAFDFDYGRSRAETLKGQSHSFVTELQSVLGDNTFNVARMQFSWEGRPRMGNDTRPTLEVRLPSGQRIRYGGTFAAFQNNMEERKVQLVNNLTHVVGRHTFKVGGNFIATNILNQFQQMGSRSQGAGIYQFGSLEDLRNYQPSSYWRPLRPDGVVPFADFNVYEWALFAQNEFEMTERLTTTVGLRYDYQVFADQPGRVVDVERAFGLQTGIAPVDRNNFSPRLSLAYDVLGNGESVLRAGGGIFYGRLPYVLGGNVQQTEEPVYELLCAGDLGDPTAPPRPTGYANWSTDGHDNPIRCAEGGTFAGTPTYSFWQEGFEYPETFKANVGYEQLLFDGLTRAALDFSFTNSTGLYTVRNLNLREHQFTLDNEGGRRVFVPREHFDPTGAAGPMNRVNTDFGQILVNYNDGVGRAFSVNFDVDQRVTETTSLRGSYTYTTSYDNSSYSCCTASAGFTNPAVGAYGPNDIGTIGDTDKAWGPSDHVRNHTFVLSGRTEIPFGFQLSTIWRLQSGRPWSPEQSGDLNADGRRFRDRPFIFHPDELPLVATGETAAQQRALYAQYLDDNPCVGDYVGQIIPRNTCRQPWFNKLDVRLRRVIPTARAQRAELEIDLFNVFNGLGYLLAPTRHELEDGTVRKESTWGRYHTVSGSARNLIEPRGFDASTGTILYQVPGRFGEPTHFSGLIMQFQAQVGVRYRF